MNEEEQEPSIPLDFGVKTSDNKFLWLVPSKEASGYLQFCGDSLMKAHAKFAVEHSKVVDGFVHIRCCYNNKYWVLQSQSSHCIVAAAKKKEEDTSKPTCTLFKPVFDEAGDGFFRLRNAHLNRFLHKHDKAESEEGLKGCLFANSQNHESDGSDKLFFLDWDSFCFLPRYMAFKGDNGYYLRPFHINSRVAYLRFSSSDITDPGIKHEIKMLPTGAIRVKNLPYNEYWMHDPDWIKVQAIEKGNEKHGLFMPIKVDDNVVALRSLGNNHICKRLTDGGKQDCLNAAAGRVVQEARLQVVELVYSRKIYNINFRLSDSRIYDEKPLVLATSHGQNLKDVPDKISVKLSYEDTVTTTWSNTVSVKYGIKITIEGGAPKISENEIEISGEIENENTWGRTQQTKATVEVVHDVVVPPRSKIKASILATQGTCNVPYSYTQRDELWNGKIAIRRLDDGIFTGINCYNYKFVAEQEKI